MSVLLINIRGSAVILMLVLQISGCRKIGKDSSYVFLKKSAILSAKLPNLIENINYEVVRLTVPTILLKANADTVIIGKDFNQNDARGTVCVGESSKNFTSEDPLEV